MCILLNITNSNNNITSQSYKARLLGKPTDGEALVDGSERLKRGFSTISSIVPLKAARSQGECELLP